MDTILAGITVSVTELERNFTAVLKQADNSPVAVLNHNRPAAHYEHLMAYLEDMEDATLVREGANGPFVEVGLDEL